MSSSSNGEQIKLARKYLKLKILEDNVTFRRLNRERQRVYELIKKTITCGESHSALIIGDRGSGKTTLVNSVLRQLNEELDITEDAIVVKLNGVIHHDDAIALKSIAAQMQLENAVGDRVFGTLAENFSYLLSCLQTGSDRSCKSLVFVLDEFDGFCHTGVSQSLLYNLFDITHSNRTPMCVIGLTSRPDVMELLEKRVKSRFSHIHIFLFPNETNDVGKSSKGATCDIYADLFLQLLTLPLSMRKVSGIPKKKKIKTKENAEKMDVDISNVPTYEIPEEVLSKCKTDKSVFDSFDWNFVSNWNHNISDLIRDRTVLDSIEKFCYYTTNEQIFRDILFQTVSKVSASKPHIDAADFCATIDKMVDFDGRVLQLTSLSILEFSLVIAMKHGMEIFNGDPMNFEMVLRRYTSFANANSTAQTVPRQVILKAFEHLQALKVIVPVKSTDFAYANEHAGTKMQKEYQPYALDVPLDTLDDAVRLFRCLPTEINHWYSNSVV